MAETMRVVVTGRVQGVWFRGWTREQAASIGVRGWVRNLPTGQVEALVQGNPATLEVFLGLVRRGPPSSRVAEVDAERVDTSEFFETFEIRY